MAGPVPAIHKLLRRQGVWRAGTEAGHDDLGERDSLAPKRMDLQTALASCEASVRRHDPDRYFATLFAPEDRRPLLFALYAFNHELASVAENAREPMMGRIRLQWWRETVEAARDLHQRGHDVAHALVEVFAGIGPPIELFEAMIDAREHDAADLGFADMAALEAYADATGGNLMRLASLVLGASEHDALAREAGIVTALTGILRTVPFHGSRRSLMLPHDLLAEHDIAPEDVFAGKAPLKPVYAAIAERARAHLAAARALPKPGIALPAFLPVALVPLYLKAVTRPGFDPFRHPAEVALFRRQAAFLKASVTGHV